MSLMLYAKKRKEFKPKPFAKLPFLERLEGDGLPEVVNKRETEEGNAALIAAVIDQQAMNLFSIIKTRGLGNVWKERIEYLVGEMKSGGPINENTKTKLGLEQASWGELDLNEIFQCMQSMYEILEAEPTKETESKPKATPKLKLKAKQKPPDAT